MLTAGGYAACCRIQSPDRIGPFHRSDRDIGGSLERACGYEPMLGEVLGSSRCGGRRTLPCAPRERRSLIAETVSEIER